MKSGQLIESIKRYFSLKIMQKVKQDQKFKT